MPRYEVFYFICHGELCHDMSQLRRFTTLFMHVIQTYLFQSAKILILS